MILLGYNTPDLAQRQSERIDYTNRRVAEYDLITQRTEAIAPEEAQWGNCRSKIVLRL